MTTRLVPLEDAEIELIKEEFSDYEPDIDYFTGKTITYPEREKLFKKLQACLKGEAGLDEEEMYDLLQWGDSLVPFTDETNKCASPEIAEKLRSYLGECE